MTNCDQTKNGSFIHVMPGARPWTTVAIMVMAPSEDDNPIRKMPTSQKFCPAEAITASGTYDVQPEFGAPPSTKKLASITSPPARYSQ